MKELEHCVFFSPSYLEYNCFCNKRLFKKLTGIKKEKQICPYPTKSGYFGELQFLKCKVFKKFHKIHSDIMHNKYDDYFELQSYIQIQDTYIERFLCDLANDYYEEHYRSKMIKKIIKKFKTNMSIALATKCNEIKTECPYFVISKDIKVSREKV